MNGRLCTWWFVLLAALTLVGCAQRTQVIVVVDADEVIRRTPADHVHVYVRGDAAGAIAEGTPYRRDVTRPATYPFRIVLTPSGENAFGYQDRNYEVIVALHPTDDGSLEPEDSVSRRDSIITARVRSGYVRGETRVLEMMLDSRCRPASEPVCAEDRTCGGGSCVPLFREPGSLPTLATYQTDTGPADTGPLDASGDAGIDAPLDAAPHTCNVREFPPPAVPPLTVGTRFGASVATSEDGGTLAAAIPGMARVRVETAAAGSSALLGGRADDEGTDMQVALSADGNTLAVGWPFGRDPTRPEGLKTTGVVEVYVRRPPGVDWVRQDVLFAPNAYEGARFGAAVALNRNGTLLAIGAPNESSASTTGLPPVANADGPASAGAVYLYKDGGAGRFEYSHFLTARTRQADDNFGASVALSADGTTLAVGIPGESSVFQGVSGTVNADLRAPSSGAVYVYAIVGAEVMRSAYIKAHARAGVDYAGDRFGSSVALDGSGATLLVGSPLEDGSATGFDSGVTVEASPDSGAAYLYRRVGSSWSPSSYLKSLATTNGGLFGISVAISGDGSWLAAGAPREMDDAGAVYLYGPPGTFLSPPNSTMRDPSALGRSVALTRDGSLLVVGAPGTSESRGAVFLYSCR